MLKLKCYVSLPAAQAKLAAVDTSHGEGQTKLSQRIQKLQEDIVFLRDEKEKDTKKDRGTWESIAARLVLKKVRIVVCFVVTCLFMVQY